MLYPAHGVFCVKAYPVRVLLDCHSVRVSHCCWRFYRSYDERNCKNNSGCFADRVGVQLLAVLLLRYWLAFNGICLSGFELSRRSDSIKPCYQPLRCQKLRDDEGLTKYRQAAIHQHHPQCRPTLAKSSLCHKRRCDCYETMLLHRYQQPLYQCVFKRLAPKMHAPITHHATQGAAAQPAPEIAIVGGGITGLTCANLLAKYGYTVTVFDQGKSNPGK